MRIKYKKIGFDNIVFKARLKSGGKMFEPIFRYDPFVKPKFLGKVFVTDKEGGRYIPECQLRLYVGLIPKK